MYSVHAWTGSIAIALFFVQYFVGLAVFAVFKSSFDANTKKNIMHWHLFFGKVSFFAGLGACVNGLADMQMMMQMSGQVCAYVHAYVCMFIYFRCMYIYSHA